MIGNIRIIRFAASLEVHANERLLYLTIKFTNSDHGFQKETPTGN